MRPCGRHLLLPLAIASILHGGLIGQAMMKYSSGLQQAAAVADKINLSNSTEAESQDVEIAAEGDNVIVTWWEHNQTAEEPVAKISTDNGATFGPLLKLATNGTIGQPE